MESSPGAIGVDRLRARREVEVEPLRLEVLHQERRLGERRALHVGIDADPPGAAHRVRGKIDRRDVAAEAFVGERDAALLLAVRPRDDRGQGHVLDRAGGRVADERRGVDRLADAVDAALGGQEHVERLRRLAAFDAAVGQVHRRLGEVEEAVVAGRRLGGQEPRRHRAGAADQAGREIGVAGRNPSSPRRAPRC